MPAAIYQLSISDFLQQSKGFALLDVRAPKEYNKGHIPGAVSFPLFNDEERAEVGTAYKQQSKEKAIELGLDIVGKKMGDFARSIKTITTEKKVFIHCWRGGMRSNALAWLIQLLGYDVFVLEGGYKAYRNYVLDQLGIPYRLYVLGGHTGCGKTDLLYALQDAGEQIIDLEKIACHKGSAFGGLGQPKQPSPEQFENNLFDALVKIDRQKICWIEDESKALGTCYIPEPFWLQLKNAHILKIHLSEEKRLKLLMEQYASFPEDTLAQCIRTLEKRMGTEAMNNALVALSENRIQDVVKLLLKYYDKAYSLSASKKTNPIIEHLLFEEQNNREIAHILIQKSLT